MGPMGSRVSEYRVKAWQQKGKCGLQAIVAVHVTTPAW